MNAPPSPQSTGLRAWLVIRFLVFACGGLVVLFFGVISFTERVFDHDQHSIPPMVSLPISFLSLLMLLYGTGEWGRWRYLSVFVLLPVSFLVPVWIYWLATGAVVPMPIPFVIMGIVGFFAHTAVRRYYANRKSPIAAESLD